MVFFLGFICSQLQICMFTGGCCNDCMGRMPYATLIATVMCILGVGVFCFTVYRTATLSALMFDHVFHFRLAW